jgi:hypothetical protein
MPRSRMNSICSRMPWRNHCWRKSKPKYTFKRVSKKKAGELKKELKALIAGRSGLSMDSELLDKRINKYLAAKHAGYITNKDKMIAFQSFSVEKTQVGTSLVAHGKFMERNVSSKASRDVEKELLNACAREILGKRPSGINLSWTTLTASVMAKSTDIAIFIDFLKAQEAIEKAFPLTEREESTPLVTALGMLEYCVDSPGRELLTNSWESEGANFDKVKELVSAEMAQLRHALCEKKRGVNFSSDKNIAAYTEGYFFNELKKHKNSIKVDTFAALYFYKKIQDHIKAQAEKDKCEIGEEKIKRIIKENLFLWINSKNDDGLPEYTWLDEQAKKELSQENIEQYAGVIFKIYKKLNGVFEGKEIPLLFGSGVINLDTDHREADFFAAIQAAYTIKNSPRFCTYPGARHVRMHYLKGKYKKKYAAADTASELNGLKRLLNSIERNQILLQINEPVSIASFLAYTYCGLNNKGAEKERKIVKWLDKNYRVLFTERIKELNQQSNMNEMLEPTPDKVHKRIKDIRKTSGSKNEKYRDILFRLIPDTAQGKATKKREAPPPGVSNDTVIDELVKTIKRIDEVDRRLEKWESIEASKIEDTNYPLFEFYRKNRKVVDSFYYEQKQKRKEERGRCFPTVCLLTRASIFASC